MRIGFRSIFNSNCNCMKEPLRNNVGRKSSRSLGAPRLRRRLRRRGRIFGFGSRLQGSKLLACRVLGFRLLLPTTLEFRLL